MANYTDEQIKKAKAHFKYGIDCDIFSEPVLTYAKIALDAIDALDLINRQEVEIESCRRRLKTANEYIWEQEKEFDKLLEIILCRDEIIRELEKELLNAKSEAIKEFAERLIVNTFPVKIGRYNYKVISREGIEHF